MKQKWDRVISYGIRYNNREFKDVNKMVKSHEAKKIASVKKGVSCSSCGTTLNPKSKIETPSGSLCLKCWAERMGSLIEKHPVSC